MQEKLRELVVGAGTQRIRTRVLLGIRDVVFHQEVLDHLERDPRVDVVGSVSSPEALVQRMRGLDPDVTLACPQMLREIHDPAIGRSANLMVVAEEMTVPVLREAIESGARGVFAWPEERADLGEEISNVRTRSSEEATRRGQVIAVYGSRGGGGTTFVATQLAAAFADAAYRCVLIDLDWGFADVTVALRIDPEARTIASLVPVLEELGPDHLDDALFRHPRGFSVLPAPLDPSSGPSLPAGLYPASIALLSGAFDAVVLHVPRALDASICASVAIADQVILLVSPDLFSLHAAARAVHALDLADRPDRCRVVLNPAVRNLIGWRDVERVLGMTPFGTVRYDPAVERTQARGRLLPPRGRRAARDLRSLVNKLVPKGHPKSLSPAAAGEAI